MLIMRVYKNFIKKVLTGRFLSAILFTDLKIRGRPIHAKGFAMFLVKLDLSVKGLPKSISLCFPRKLSQIINCKTVFQALELARNESFAPKLESAVKFLFCSLYDIVESNSLSGVVMSARYSLFNDSDVLVADYTRYYNFDDYVSD